MQLEAFDPISPSRALVFQNQTQSLAVIIDGAGSWGSGREAADRARELLAARWRATAEWSVESVSADIATVASSTPANLRDTEFGWSFSVTCVLCTDDLVECMAAGVYRVDVLGTSDPKNLFRPELLIDQLLAEGTLTPEAAVSFAHRNICVGRFVGDRDDVVLDVARHKLLPGETVLVTHAMRYEISAIPVLISAQALAGLAPSDAYPSPVLVVRQERPSS